MDLHRQHRDELERLALRRLPLAMGVLAFFIAGALPIELYFYPDRLQAYVAVYAVELIVCVVAWIAARRWHDHALAIATMWATVLGFCVVAYYPLVGADATLAMAALICLVAAIPATLPLGLSQQLFFGSACALSFFGMLLWGLPMSLPWQYSFVAFLAVLTTSSISARTLARFRWEAFEREAILRLAHEQLRVALGHAEDSVEMRSRLVANVSHELRTPLNVIVGYTDMLLDGATDRETVNDAAPRIRQYAVSLEALVSELLDLSRLTCGKVDLHLEDIELAPLLEEVGQGARAMLHGKSVAVSIACGVMRLRSDRMRLQQILTNLATNAAKFTDAGTIAISSRSEQETIVFEVRDTGCGIPQVEHEAIFAAFQQLSPARDGKTSGIGLGLAIVRQLTDVLGGSASVTSMPGHGSTFTIRLPIELPSPCVTGDEVAASASRRAS